MIESFTLGTSSSRGYSTMRSGWLDPPDPFLSRDSVRGWPRGGSAERPSTLLVLTGQELVPSWERCAAALRAIDAMPIELAESSWLDEMASRQVAGLLGVEDDGARNDAHAAACAWVVEHVLGPWRCREAMRLHRGEAHPDPLPGCVRSPEECVAAVTRGDVVRIDRYGAAARFRAR